jgi:hypothetical protein
MFYYIDVHLLAHYIQAKNKFANEGNQGVATILGLFNMAVPDEFVESL